jgi:Flp pilus assembly protein protease CpaA
MFVADTKSSLKLEALKFYQSFFMQKLYVRKSKLTKAFSTVLIEALALFQCFQLFLLKQIGPSPK